MTLVAVSVGAEFEAGRRHRDRQGVEAVALALERLALDHGLVARRLVHEARRDRMGDRMVPLGLDVLEFGIHADAVDLRIGGDGADHHRDIVFAPAPVDDVGEQEGLAVILVHAADELPAHQRMQFRIFVDRPVDGAQQAALVQRLQMLVQVAIATRRLRHAGSPTLGGQHTGFIGGTTMPRQMDSGIILMAPHGHSVAQRLQPLQ